MRVRVPQYATAVPGNTRHYSRAVFFVAPIAAALAAAAVSSSRHLELAWLVPVEDAVAIVAFAATAALAYLDARLRQDGRSIPVLTISIAAIVLRIEHLITFPGVMPGPEGVLTNDTTSWAYLASNLLVPSLLALALLRWPRRWTEIGPGRGLLIGIGIGCAGLVITAALALSSVNSVVGNQFTGATRVDGGLGLIPALAGFALILTGRRGDTRILQGVTAALFFSAATSFVLIFLETRYSPVWYAAHVLGLMPAIALFAGQLGVYRDSVRAEQATEAWLRLGLRVAEDLAATLDPAEVQAKLVETAGGALGAERCTLVRVDGDDVVVAACWAAEGVPGWQPGARYRVAEGHVIERALSTHHPATAIEPGELEPRPGAPAERSLRHALALPLVVAGTTEGLMIVSRQAEPDFTADDVVGATMFSNVAALALRNSRQHAMVKAANSARADFMNLAGHELRSPIAVIRGYASILRGSPALPETQREFLDIIDTKGEELGNLVENLLLSARLDSGSAPVRVVERDFRVTVADAAERARPRAGLMGGALDLKLPKSTIDLEADHDGLGIVLDNLINNALCHTPAPPEVSIEVRLAESIEVRVTDRGGGIPEPDRERIFDRFVRLGNGRGPSGSGLGLSISRTLVRRSGGSLILESSEPGVGTTFLLRLPSGRVAAGVGPYVH